MLSPERVERRRFVRHFLEMVVAMIGGMVVFGGLVSLFCALTGHQSLLELAVQRGRTAGIHAAQRRQIRHYHRLKPPAGDDVTVLAGGTAAEELIEGLSIGVGVAIQPGLALIVGASIALDNLAEALSIGALIAEKDRGPVRSAAARRRVLKWTGAIGGALFSSSVASWLLLRTVSSDVLGLLIATGAGCSTCA